MQLSSTERWIALVRAIAVPFAVFQVAVSSGYPPGYETWAWTTTGALAAGAAVFYVLTSRALEPNRALVLSLAGQLFDTAVLSTYVVLYYFEASSPTPQVLYVAVIAASVRFGTVGGIVTAALTAAPLAVFEGLRSDHAHSHYRWDFVTLQVGLEAVLALIVGWLVGRLAAEGAHARARAEEAERLRDELGRRADLLDAIVLAEGGDARVMAAAGAGADEVFPAGSAHPLAGTLLEDVLTSGQPVYRRRLDPARYPEERQFRELGLGSRLAAPLIAAARPIGMLSVVRRDEDAFEPAEIELLALLGRVVASAAQNIHAYESERRTVEELRRLSTLRADFVSLVSHELRSPMAAVIGSARTLQRRWRELSPEHRDSFLALIADETGRLAALVGDVLDTSRIDAGTFPYSFGEVDLGALVEEAVAGASAAQDAVEVVARVPRRLPHVRGDASRLRQVLVNLLDNAVKYSPDGGVVEVHANATNGRLVVEVSDSGSGIAAEDQQVIFEKFGRVRGGASKPGTGLGLYIARSIAEAHGGSLGVVSDVGRGATFTLTLPAA